MSHRRFQMLAATVLDFEPTPAQRIELAAHLAICAECRRTEAALRADAHALRERARVAPPPGMRDRVATTWRRPVRSREIDHSVRLLLVAAALLLAVVGVSVVGGNRRLVLPPAPLPIPKVGTASDLAVPAGAVTHEHLCHVIVASECGAAIAATAAGIWTTSGTGIVRLDPLSGLVAQESDIGAFPHRMAATTDGSVWVALADPDRLVRLPAAGRQVVEIGIDGQPSQMVVDDVGLWVVLPATREVLAFDADTGQGIRSLTLTGDPWRIASLDGEIWVVDRLATTLWRIAQATGALVETVDLAHAERQLTTDQNFASANGLDAAVGPMVGAFGRLWIPGESGVLVFDPSSGTVDVRLLPSSPILIATPRGVAVVSRINRRLEILDPVTLDVVAQQTLDVGRPPTYRSQWELPGSASADGSIWLRDYERDRVIRITPDR